MVAVDARLIVAEENEITAAWLSDTLRAAGHLSHGDVATLAVERWRERSHSVIHRLRATYTHAPKLPASYVLKVGRPEITSPVAERRRSKEFDFYTRVVPGIAPLPVPRPFAAAYEPRTRRSMLLIEDLTETHVCAPLPLPPGPEQLRSAVDCLATIHAWRWDHPEVAALAGERDAGWVAERTSAVHGRVERFLGAFGNHLPASTLAVVETVAAGWPAVMRRAATVPLTLVHGDAHPGNFLTPRGASTDRSRLLDWEGWAVDPGMYDLPSLIALYLPARERREIERELVSRYVERLRDQGVVPYDFDTAWGDYRLGIARRTLSPVSLWSRGSPARSWWPALEHMTAAFHDLDCAEALVSHQR